MFQQAADIGVVHFFCRRCGFKFIHEFLVFKESVDQRFEIIGGYGIHAFHKPFKHALNISGGLRQKIGRIDPVRGKGFHNFYDNLQGAPVFTDTAVYMRKIPGCDAGGYLIHIIPHHTFYGSGFIGKGYI